MEPHSQLQCSALSLNQNDQAGDVPHTALHPLDDRTRCRSHEPQSTSGEHPAESPQDTATPIPHAASPSADQVQSHVQSAASSAPESPQQHRPGFTAGCKLDLNPNGTVRGSHDLSPTVSKPSDSPPSSKRLRQDTTHTLPSASHDAAPLYKATPVSFSLAVRDLVAAQHLRTPEEVCAFESRLLAALETEQYTEICGRYKATLREALRRHFADASGEPVLENCERLLANVIPVSFTHSTGNPTEVTLLVHHPEHRRAGILVRLRFEKGFSTQTKRFWNRSALHVAFCCPENTLHRACGALRCTAAHAVSSSPSGSASPSAGQPMSAAGSPPKTCQWSVASAVCPAPDGTSLTLPVPAPVPDAQQGTESKPPAPSAAKTPPAVVPQHGSPAEQLSGTSCAAARRHGLGNPYASLYTEPPHDVSEPPAAWLIDEGALLSASSASVSVWFTPHSFKWYPVCADTPAVESGRTLYLLHFVHAAAMLVLGATLPISLFYQVLWGLVGGPALTNESIVNFLSTPTREMDEPHLVPEPMTLRELDGLCFRLLDQHGQCCE